MKQVSALVALAVTGSAVTAQSAVVAAITPLTVTATAGTQTQTLTVPAGPLPLWNDLSVSTTNAPAATATLVSYGYANSGEVGCQVNMACVAPAGGQATVTPADYRLTMTLPVTMAVRPRIEFELVAPNGTAIPAIGVDVHDDGAFEFTEQNGSSMTLPLLAVGPTPVFVRLRVGAALTVPGTFLASLRFEVTPDTMTETKMLDSCVPHLLDYELRPRFDGDLDYSPVAFGQSFPILAVAFGLQAQSTVVGIGPAGPCLALPRLDIVTLAASGHQTIAVPAAVRPLRLWTQAATLASGSIITSEAYMVVAN